MTDNSIAFPLSSVATKSSLEKSNSAKESAPSNCFQSVLDSYVIPSNADDKPIKNDTNKIQNKLTDDYTEVTENKLKETSENEETVLIEKDTGNQSTEAMQVIPLQVLVDSNKKEQTLALTEELQPSDIESINLQDDTNLPAPSLINIIAAQSFNNKLAKQEKNIASATETTPASAIVVGPGSETLNKLNLPTQTHGEAFADQLSPKIAVANKADTEAVKFINTNLETQSTDQPKLVNTINEIDTPSPIVGQSQTNPQIANVNSTSQSLSSYAVLNNFYSDNWNTSVHQQVLSLRHNNIDNATLILNPEHLGPIHVSIQIDAQSQTSIQFWSQNADVRQALRDGLPNLNSLFQASGLQLDSADVSSQQNSSDNSHPKFNQFNSESAELIDDSSMESQINTSLSVKNLVNVYI